MTHLTTTTEAARLTMSERSDLPEGFRLQQDARLLEAIAEYRSASRASAFGAAQSYARGGDIRSASRLAERAWIDPQRQADVGAAAEFWHVSSSPLDRLADPVTSQG